MAIQDPIRVYDGFEGLEGGVDGGRRANAIDPNQAESADNMTFRGGIASTRPAISALSSNFLNPDNSYNPDGTYAGAGVDIAGQEADTIFQAGRFQCALYFAPHNFEQESILAMISGRLFKLVPRRTSVDITEIILSKRNRDNITKVYMVQADKWAVIQDGESKPILYDNSNVRRAGKTEVIVGEKMAYGMGRLVVTKNNDIFFGDLYGSLPTDDPADSVISFTETTFLSEGQPAAITADLGKISAAAFFPQLDTSTGLGALMVYTERGAASFFLNLPRDQWKTSLFQLVTLKTTGVRGWRSLVEVNEDQFFRSEDGERSFRQARAEPAGWNHIPLSTNVEEWLNSDTPYLLDYASAVYFDNRIFQTVSPVWNAGRVYHEGLVVLDFDVLSSFGQRSKPAWDGHYSGYKISQLVAGQFSGERRAFAFALDANGNNVLLEIEPSGMVDDSSGPIPWELVTRSFNFANDKSSSPFNEKELYSGDIWFEEILDNMSNLQVYYRPDDYEDWIPWPFKALPTLGPIMDSDDTLAGMPTSLEGFYPRVTLIKPPDQYDQTTKRNLRRGYEFQVKINGTGRASIVRFRLHANQLIEDSKA
jgi:hypothetical protein